MARSRVTSSSHCGLLTASSAHITRKWAAITDTPFTSYRKCHRRAQRTSIIKCENRHASFGHFNSNPSHAPRWNPRRRHRRPSSPSSCPLLFFVVLVYFTIFLIITLNIDVADGGVTLLIRCSCTCKNETNKSKMTKWKTETLLGLTCTILDTIVCVRGSVCESDERGEGGWGGGREKRGQENYSSSFFP